MVLTSSSNLLDCLGRQYAFITEGAGAGEGIEAGLARFATALYIIIRDDMVSLLTYGVKMVEAIV
jgi:hypothetical protein